MIAQVAIKLVGPMDHLRLIWQTGESLLETVRFDDDPEGNRYNILLALQEMVTNVLRHGYQMDPSRPVEVVFAVGEDAFDVTLRDSGPAFDPLAHQVAESVRGAEMPTESGGFGIHIARLVMDSLSYRRVDDWNELRMSKCLRVSATT